VQSYLAIWEELLPYRKQQIIIEQVLLSKYKYKKPNKEIASFIADSYILTPQFAKWAVDNILKEN